MKQTKSKKKKVQLKTKITCHYRTSGNVENTKPLYEARKYLKVHVYILLGYEPKFIQVPIGKGKFFFRKSKNAERRHLEQSMRKLNTKYEHSTRVGST